MISVKQRIQKLSSDQTPTVAPRDSTKIPRQRPMSSAFEMFEKRGLIMGMVRTVRTDTEIHTEIRYIGYLFLCLHWS